ARPSLWLLLVPALLHGAAPLVANRVEPRVLGVPFLLAWMIAATVVSPLVIWLVARLDPAYRWRGRRTPASRSWGRPAGRTPSARPSSTWSPI
ncbi:DUF3311 domain-containing protein, partial [Streptomyces silaceus]|uniref:DUF3311 domain-containing protein n=1 Tax=Streptomyces silaceus TaxID=545123 RepID=UPI0012FEBDEF